MKTTYTDVCEGGGNGNAEQRHRIRTRSRLVLLLVVAGTTRTCILCTLIHTADVTGFIFRPAPPRQSIYIYIYNIIGRVFFQTKTENSLTLPLLLYIAAALIRDVAGDCTRSANSYAIMIIISEYLHRYPQSSLRDYIF